jgi:hypothetical protein
MAGRSHIEEVQEEAALFALGALKAGEAERFRQRLAAGCPLCCAAVADCEETLAAIALSAPQAAPPSDLRAQLLERAAGVPKPAAGEPVIVRANASAWKPTPVPGVQFRPLLDGSTFLIRMAPKTSYPAHEHAAAEQCLMLEGSVTSEGVTAYTGDYIYMPKGSTHQPLYSEDGCVFLIAYT